MAKKYFLIAFILIQGCASAVKVDPRFDPAVGLGANEGTVSGVYMHPIAISRPIAFPDARRAELTFQGMDAENVVQVQTSTSGEFSFKVAAGKYRLSRILVRPQADIFEGPKDGFTVQVESGKNVNLGSLYSSCDQWNDNDKVRKKFQELVSMNQYDSFKRYDSKEFSCLVFLQTKTQ